MLTLAPACIKSWKLSQLIEVVSEQPYRLQRTPAPDGGFDQIFNPVKAVRMMACLCGVGCMLHSSSGLQLPQCYAENNNDKPRSISGGWHNHAW